MSHPPRHTTQATQDSANGRDHSMTTLYVVQGNYGYGHGWEDLTQSEDIEEARIDLKAYRDNAPEYAYRLRKRRGK